MMPDTSPILGLPIAKGSDPLKQFPSTVDSPRTIALEKYTIPRFASAAARDTAIPVPVNGQLAWLNDLGQQQIYRTTPAVPANGWYPSAGAVPRAKLGGVAAQSIPLQTWTKLTFPDAPTLAGGMTWDAAQSSVSGPPGLYLVSIELSHSVSAAGYCHVLLADNVSINNSGQSMGLYNILSATVQPIQVAAIAYRIASPTFKASLWAYTSPARNIDYKAAAFTYLSH